MRVWQISIGLAAAMIASTQALAAEIAVSNAWIRAMPAHLPAGGYFSLQNHGGKDVSLTGAASSACGMLMLHRSMNDNGMASMGDVESVDVPSGKTISFAPGGYHLMCDDPRPAIKPGAKIVVVLQFSDKTSLRVPFAVRNAMGR